MEQWAVSAAMHEDEWEIQIVEVPKGSKWNKALKEAYPEFWMKLHLQCLDQEENTGFYENDLDQCKAMAPDQGWCFDCVKIPRMSTYG